MKTKLFLTILCVCFSINLHSQEGGIIYTDFEPDTMMRIIYYANQVPRELDVNRDKITDFYFDYDNNPQGIIPSIRLATDGIVDEFVFYPMEDLSLNDTIPFIDSEWSTCHETFIVYGDVRYYNIGLRSDLGNGNWCYGWIKLCISVLLEEMYDIYVIVYDMAYCTVPNYPLRMGQKIIEDLATDEITESRNYVLYPSPAKNKLTLKFNDNTYDNEIKIYSMDGRLLKTQNSDFENINVSNLPSGVYIIKIHLSNGECFTEKFVKE